MISLKMLKCVRFAKRKDTKEYLQNSQMAQHQFQLKWENQFQWILFYIDNNLYVTSIDRYSKYLLVHPIQSKLNFNEKLEEILTQIYPECQNLITDNEAVFVSNASKIIYQKYKIMHITTPVQHSTSNQPGGTYTQHSD